MIEFFLIYILPKLLAVIGIILLILLIDLLGFWGCIILGAIVGVISFVVSLFSKNSPSEDSQVSEPEEQDKKKWGYREAGLWELHSDGRTDNCSECKYYDGMFCILQADWTDSNSTCRRFER